MKCDSTKKRPLASLAGIGKFSANQLAALTRGYRYLVALTDEEAEAEAVLKDTPAGTAVNEKQ